MADQMDRVMAANPAPELERRWLVRLINRWTGIDMVDYWRARHNATRELLVQLHDEAKKALNDAEATIRVQTAEVNKWRERAIKEGGELEVERGARLLLQNLVTEIGQQAAKQRDVAPATMLGVIDVATHEAVRTVENMLATGKADVAEIINVRATIANRLLPDARQPTVDRAGNRPAIVTERKRDGKAGDSTTRPDPMQPHTYEYDLFAAPNTLNREGLLCFLQGCGKRLSDPIHQPDKGWTTSGSITAEVRPDDGPPQTLPPAHVFEQCQSPSDACCHVWRDGELWRVCTRPGDDPIHIV